MNHRTDGKLKSWNEERGFGFILATHSGEEIFVHISQFPRGGSRPQIGEALSFEVTQRPDGRKQAVKLVRPQSALSAGAHRSRALSTHRDQRSPVRAGATAIVILIFTVLAYGQYSRHQASIAKAAPSSSANSFAAPARRLQSASTRQAASNNSANAFTAPARQWQPAASRCDGRTPCTQMSSCAEANYFLQHCPGVQMDGDGDGVPCEGQWCQ